MIVDEDIIKDVISANIRLKRIKAKLSQEELAEKSNISVSFLRDIETKRSNVSLLTLVNICYALKTTPNELLSEVFKTDVLECDKLVSQINTLTNTERNAIITLIHYYNNFNK